jgi:hypothetical protein
VKTPFEEPLDSQNCKAPILSLLRGLAFSVYTHRFDRDAAAAVEVVVACDPHDFKSRFYKRIKARTTEFWFCSDI